MKSVCAWCKVLLEDDGERGDAPDGDDLVSHGCCRPCSDKIFRMDEDEVDPATFLLRLPP